MDEFEYETIDQYENDLNDYEYQQEIYDIDMEEVFSYTPDEV